MQASRTSSKKLLTPKQQKSCEIIASAGSIDSPRAKALLLLQNGLTQAETVVETGLSLGQVKYWLTRFRSLGIACFSTSEVPVEKTDINESETEKVSIDDSEVTKKIKKDKKKKTKSKNKDKKDDKDKKKDKKKKDKKKKKK